MDDSFFAEAKEYLCYTGVPYCPVLVVAAQGTKLFTSNGKTILDFTSGQMSSLLGHSHPEIVGVVSSQVGKLDHLLSNMVTEPVVELAKSLAEVLPQPLSRSFFLNTGSESTEAALKMAKMVTGKYEIVAFSASYHGLTGAAAAATYSAGRKGGGPVMPGQITFPTPNRYRSPFRNDQGEWDWEKEVDFGWSLVDAQSTGSLAAFILEPILSTGGILDLPKGYLEKMRAECDKRKMLLILDEAQTGVGRTGQLFAFEYENVVPDILCLSKTLGCGLPLASVTTSDDIESKLREAGFLWLTTHLNDPLTAAVGVKALEIVKRNDYQLVRNAAERGDQLRIGLEWLKSRWPQVGDIRGRGLLQGIEIVSNRETKSPGAHIGARVSAIALEKGLSCNVVSLPGMGGVFRLAPPITVSQDEINDAIRILDQAFAVAAQEGFMAN